MEQRTLGASGLKVSLLGLGCNNFGGRIGNDAACEVIHKALDLGITLFDTADFYGNRGGSEACLGQFLGERRKDIILASKFGNPMDDAGTHKGASRRHIMSAVEASLKRLKTDWIDLYQLHHPDILTPIEETLRALDDLVRQGKIRYIGCCNIAAWQLVDMQWTARHHKLNPLVSFQVEYSILARNPERELVPAMQAHGIGLLPYFPLAGGFLTGKYRRGAPIPEGARLTRTYRHTDRFLNEANWARLERLEAFCRERGRSLLELAIGWLAAQPVVSSVIAGAAEAGQLEINVKALNAPLTPQELEEIDRLT